MWQEYLNKTIFVVMHGCLLGIYALFFGYSCWLLVREHFSLATLKRRLRQSSHKEARPEELDLAEANPRLADFKNVVHRQKETTLIAQLRGISDMGSTGEDFDSSRVIERVGRAISWPDDILRFCVNGLVIVGLMGTLYAFYQMWRNSDPSNLAASSKTYLDSMSTALIVSFVGLVLALVTNLLFSVLKALRQRFAESIASFLTPIAALLPSDSKTNLLLTNLLTPLNRLVKQLKIQNEEVLRGLTEAVNTRTEQLNHLISEATKNWQSVIQEFKQETLTAVGGLQHASATLSGSSREVAVTMAEVSRSLERTKDIGLIVNRLEQTSEKIVSNIAQKLDQATDTWTKSLSEANRQYEKLIEQQQLALIGTVEGLTAGAATNFNSVANKISADLDMLKSKFHETTDAVGGKWMNEMNSAIRQMTLAMAGIVAGWQESVQNTSATVQTSLVGARELMNETGEKVKTVSENLSRLQAIVNAVAEETGAPINLSEAVGELVKANESLTILAADLMRRETLDQLNTALGANSGELRELREELGKLGLVANANKDLLKAINDTKMSFYVALVRLEDRIAKSAFAQQL